MTRRSRVPVRAALALIAAAVVLAAQSVSAFAVSTPMTSPQAPALLAFNVDDIHVAWIGTDANNTLNIASTNDGGLHWSHSIQPFGRGNSTSSPALTTFNGRYYMAWTGTDANHNLNIASSADGVTFTQAIQPLGRNNSPDGPALASFNGRLYMAWRGTDANSSLNLSSSADGVHFTAPEQLGRNSTGQAPALAACFCQVGGAVVPRLYIAWQGTDANRLLNIAYSTDGANFTGFTHFQFGTNHTPSLTAAGTGVELAWTSTAVDHPLNTMLYLQGPLPGPIGSIVTNIHESPAVSGPVFGWLDHSDRINICGGADCP